MKLRFLLLTILLSGFSMLNAHEHHFAFIEVEYYPTEQQFQATLRVTAHDLAYITSKKHGKDYSIEQILKTDSLKSELEHFLLAGFMLYQNNQEIFFKTDGQEITAQGDLILYLSSETVERKGKLFASFSLLTQYFPDQQNKLDYLLKGKHHTLSFLANESLKEIPIQL